jgi:cytochrome oxidase Cu insertion factor (SCO1/SenC/PrrC family)
MTPFSLSRRFVAALCGLLLAAAAQAQMPKVGDKAPDFSLPSTTGKAVSLADHLGKRNIVLFFYVAAFTDT